MELADNRVTVQMEGHDESIVKLLLHENLNLLISCCNTKIKMWTLQGDIILTKVFDSKINQEIHEHDLTSLILIDNKVYTSSLDKKISIWEVTADSFNYSHDFNLEPLEFGITCMIRYQES